MTNYLESFGFYNRWANERLFKTLKSEISPNILNLLAQQIGAEELWMGRIQKPNEDLKAVQPDFVYLERRRRSLDEDWIDLVESKLDLGRNVEYETITEPRMRRTAQLERILLHVFNSQTFSRGQICAELQKPPPLEMIYFFSGR